jgi:hypothetical protein
MDFRDGCQPGIERPGLSLKRVRKFDRRKSREGYSVNELPVIIVRCPPIPPISLYDPILPPIAAYHHAVKRTADSTLKPDIVGIQR